MDFLIIAPRTFQSPGKPGTSILNGIGNDMRPYWLAIERRAVSPDLQPPRDFARISREI